MECIKIVADNKIQIAMKKYFALFMLVLINSFVFCQNQKTIIKKTYYDVFNTNLMEEMQVTGNGYINGYYKKYHKNGKLAIDKIIKTEDIDPYLGTSLKWKEYDVAGNLVWSVNRNQNKEYDGEQICYAYAGTSIKPKTKALFKSGKLVSFERYNNGIKNMELIVGSSYKTFYDTGEIMDNVTISSTGKFSGILYQGFKKELVIEVKDGKIQKVKPIGKWIGNYKEGWEVYRKDPDTLVSAFVQEGVRSSSFYLDDKVIELNSNPTINTEFSDWERGEFHLDFIPSEFMSAGYNEKIAYHIFYYNKDLLKYIKTEDKSVTSGKLLSIFTPEKETTYFPNGKIKLIKYSKTQWEEYDENGKIINNYELNLKGIYKKSYDIIKEKKLEFLRCRYGWNKYMISLRNNENEWFKNYGYTSLYIYSFNETKAFFKSNEVQETKNLLEKRSKLLNILLIKDNAFGLFDGIHNKTDYEIKVNEGYVNTFNSYQIVLNNLLLGSLNKIFDEEPTEVFSNKIISSDKLDIVKDSDLIDEITNPNSLLLRENYFEIGNEYFPLDKDFRFISNEWLKYDENYISIVKQYIDIIDVFMKALQNKGERLDKKLKDKNSYDEIMKILNESSN